MKIRPHLEDINIYEAGKPIEMVVREFGIAPEEIIKLASNENPLGTAPKVADVLCRYAVRAHLYPDDSMHALKDALAKRFGVEPNNLIIGAGSDQVLAFISHLLLHPGTSILTSRVSFAMYEIYARHHGAEVFKTESFRHIPDEFVSAIKAHHPGIVYLCTPNNPTGDAMLREDLIAVIENASEETFFVVDGAYMEYAASKNRHYAIEPKELLKYENVLYLGTFSKAYGLGGMRIGYGIAQPHVISMLYRVRPPFNVTTLSTAAALAALEDVEFLERTLRVNKEQMSRYEDFAQKHAIRYIKSYTNFITYLFGEKIIAAEICDALLKKGVIIRDLTSYGMNGVRITIGSPDQNDRLFAALEEVI